jgi:hypothetical protein
MTYTQEQKDRAKSEGTVLYKAEFDFRHVLPREAVEFTKSRQQWGTMPLERARRILAILSEDS